MSWNAVDMANSMRRESAPVVNGVVVAHSDAYTQSIVWLVLFVIVIVHASRFLDIVGNEEVYVHDFLPVLIVLVGCVMYANDTVCGRSLCGIVKLVACIAISHVFIPMMWETPEIRKSCKHVADAERENRYADGQ